MAGIFVTRGARLQIPPGGLQIRADGNHTLTVHVGYDSFPQWLSAAAEHAARCWKAARAVDEAWPKENEADKVRLIEIELRQGMETFVSAAACVDGFYAASKHLMMQNGFQSAARSARHKNISELFRRGYRFDRAAFKKLSAFLKGLFDGRDEAVHPRSTASEAVPHPRLPIAVNRQLAIFTGENALQVMDSTCNLLAYLLESRRPKYKKLEELTQLGTDWLLPQIEDWRSKRADLVREESAIS